MNINQFLNKGINTVKASEKVQAMKEGVKEVGTKSFTSLSAIAKTVTPANVRMVERVEKESVARDLEIIGNAHIVRDRVNQISELLGLAPIDVMTEEETAAYIQAVEEAARKAKEVTKEEKKTAKEEQPEEEVKNSKLKAFFESFIVPKKESNPLESSAKTDSPYPDEDAETVALRELEEKLLAQPTPIVIEAEVVGDAEVEEPVEEVVQPKKVRRATKATKKVKKAKEAAEEEVTEEKPTKRKVAVFDQPDGKYDFKDMA